MAGVIKSRESQMGIYHPVVLGNGSLTTEEASYIAQVKNIDAVGINYLEADYKLSPSPADFKILLDRVASEIGKPLIVSEFGMVALTPGGEKYQLEYFKNV